MSGRLTPLVWKRRLVAGPWDQAAAAAAAGEGETEALFRRVPEAPRQTRMGAFLLDTGIPGLPGPSATPKDTAVALLHRAAAVEHAFILQYLFAAYSLRTDDPAGVAWSRVLRQIAREEMGHLASVQNLLRCLGEAPFIDRQQYPAPDDYEFEKILEPFGVDWLGDFVIAESPMDAVLPPPLDQKGKKMARVGAIYAHLYWLFQASDSPAGSWNLTSADGFMPGEHMADADFAAPKELNDLLLQPEDWDLGDDDSIRVLAHGPYPDAASLRAGALAAIHDIAAQGEGSEPQANSHFERLLTVYSAAAAPATVLPLKRLVPNPHTSPQAAGDEGLITDPTALKVARLLNLRYWLLFTAIAHAASVARDVSVAGNNLRSVLTGDWALQDMGALRLLCQTLNTLPLKAGGDPVAGTVASAPFELPAAFPSMEAERWKFYLSAIDETKTIVSAVGAAVPGIDRIVSGDDQRRPLIESQIRG